MLGDFFDWLENLFNKVQALVYLFWLCMMGKKEDIRMELPTIKGWHSHVINLWWHPTDRVFYITFINILGDLIKVQYTNQSVGEYRISESKGITSVFDFHELILISSWFIDPSIPECDFDTSYAKAEQKMKKEDLCCLLISAYHAQGIGDSSLVTRRYFPLWKYGFVSYLSRVN